MEAGSPNNLIPFHDGELDRFVAGEEETFSALQWSQETLPLAKFIAKYTLPQIVRIEDGYYSQEEDSSLSSGQILKIHCLKSSKKILGKTQYGNDIHIPLNSTKNIILRPDNWSKTYETVNDLHQAKPLPKYVEVTRGYYDPTGDSTNVDHTVDPGEQLEVLGEAEPFYFLKPTKDRMMKFKNSKGVEIVLPFESAPLFIPLLDIKPCLIAEAVYGKKLPIYVSFVASKRNAAYNTTASSDKNLSQLGVIKLNEIYEEDFIVASCGHKSVRVVFMIPRSIDVTVKVASDTLIDEPSYRGLCQTYNNYKRIEALAIKRHEQDIYRSSGEVRGYEYYLKSSEKGEFKGMEEDDDYLLFQNDDEIGDEYALNQPTAENNILANKVTHSNGDDSIKDGKYERLLSRGSVSKVADIPTTYAKAESDEAKSTVTLLNIRRKYSNEEEEIENSQVHTYQAILPSTQKCHDTNDYVMVNADKIVDEEAMRPVQRSRMVSENEVSTHEKGEFVIPASLEGLSTEEVCKCLVKLNLGKFQKVFCENQINGELLVSLELEDYKDLSMSNFQAKKLVKFVNGWRPDL
eukprot:gene15449-17031_t